jgi:hypothetical protein
VKGAHGQNIGLTLNRFAPVSPGTTNSGDVKKQKEALFVQHSQTAAKSVQALMVQLKVCMQDRWVCSFASLLPLLQDARTNIADPNRVADKALSLGSKITNALVALIKTIKQATLGDEANTHHLLHLIPTDASKLHDAVNEMQRLMETWSWTSRAAQPISSGASNTGTLRRPKSEQLSVAKDMASQTIVQVKGLSDAVLNHDIQEFTKRAKEG